MYLYFTKIKINSKNKVIISYGGELCFFLPKKTMQILFGEKWILRRNDPKENFLRTTEEDLKDVFHKLGKGENPSTEKFKSSSSFYAKLPSLICRRLKSKANLQLYEVYF